MTTKILENAPIPGSDEWRRVVSASKVPAILGLSRWDSPYSMWQKMAGHLIEPAPAENSEKAARFMWGHIAEESLARYWRELNPGWYLNRPAPGTGGRTEITYSRTDLGFPAIATIDRRAHTRRYGPRSPRRYHIIECKLASDLSSWGRPGDVDSVPADYFAQVQFQLGVSSIETASVVVLGPFGNPEIHDIEFNPALFEGMCDRIREFYSSLENDTPPPLDDTTSTYEAVRGIHPDIDRDKTVDIDMQLATEICAAALAADAARRREAEMKTVAADIMGDARLLMCDGVKVADRRVTGRGGKPSVVINKKFLESEV